MTGAVMDYLPVRVYSVFSKGEGAVDPAAFADLLQQRGLPFLPVCDPLSLIGWDRFKTEAGKRNMRPVLGCEIRLPEKGSLLLFPASPAGYFSLIRSLNGRKIVPLEGVLGVFLPAVPDPRLVQKLRRKIGPENFYLGLEWKSPRWVAEWARQRQIPLIWAQPLRWTGDAGKYRSARRCVPPPAARGGGPGPTCASTAGFPRRPSSGGGARRAGRRCGRRSRSPRGSTSRSSGSRGRPEAATSRWRG